MTKVVNCRFEPHDIYIGRRKDTNEHFGNPFKIGPKCSREEAIQSFRMWIRGYDFPKVEPERRKWILENLHKLKDKILGCWCKPLTCHGDVYVELLEGYDGNHKRNSQG